LSTAEFARLVGSDVLAALPGPDHGEVELGVRRDGPVVVYIDVEACRADEPRVGNVKCAGLSRGVTVTLGTPEDDDAKWMR